MQVNIKLRLPTIAAVAMKGVRTSTKGVVLRMMQHMRSMPWGVTYAKRRCETST